MTPVKEIGECLITVGDEEYFFRPSFLAMTRIGEPREIVQAFYDLHNDEVTPLLQRAVDAYGIPGYESGADFITCHDAEATFWRPVPAPAAGDIAVFYRGDQPAHIGVMLTPARCLHARGENGFVRIDNPQTLLKIYTRVEYMTYGQI